MAGGLALPPTVEKSDCPATGEAGLRGDAYEERFVESVDGRLA